MTSFQQKILLMLSAIILVAYALVSFLIFPYADDFTYALKGRLPEFFQTVLEERKTWNGRYISNFILIGSPLNWGGIMGYRLMPLLLLLCSWIGLFVSIKNFKISSPGFLSSIILCVILSSLPDTGEGLYWLSGAWTYIPAAILLLLEFSMLFKSDLKKNNPIQLIVLILIGSGFNELFGLISLLFITVKFLSRKSFFFLLLLVIQVFLFYYVWSAPGNDYRASMFNNNHELFQSLKLTTLYSIRFVGEWMLNPLVYLLGYVFVTEARFNINIPILKQPITVISILVLPVIIACFGPIWSTGILGQHRTPNMACFLFFPILFLVIGTNRDILIKYLKPNQNFIFPLTVIVLLGWKNNYFLLEDFVSGDLLSYSNGLAKRVELLQSCESKFCQVPVLDNPPNTFKVYQLTPNPENWINKSYQLFYDSGKVIPEVNP